MGKSGAFQEAPVVKNPPANSGDLKRHGFDPWIGKIPWSRARQPTPVSLPEESPWTEEPDRLQSIGSQRVGHDWSDLGHMHCAKHFFPFCASGTTSVRDNCLTLMSWAFQKDEDFLITLEKAKLQQSGPQALATAMSHCPTWALLWQPAWHSGPMLPRTPGPKFGDQLILCFWWRKQDFLALLSCPYQFLIHKVIYLHCNNWSTGWYISFLKHKWEVSLFVFLKIGLSTHMTLASFST